MALRKTCPKCQSPNHCRKSQCAECGYLFSSKKSNKIEMRNKRSKKTMEMRELRKANDRERELVRVILILICVELVIDCTKLPREIMQVHMILNCVELMIDCTKLPRRIMQVHTILNCVELLCQANKRANQNDCDTERRREKDRCSTASVRDQLIKSFKNF